jgi:hypothetical protein
MASTRTVGPGNAGVMFRGLATGKASLTKPQRNGALTPQKESIFLSHSCSTSIGGAQALMAHAPPGWPRC